VTLSCSKEERTSNTRNSLAACDGWADVFIRTLIALVVAFVALLVRGWVDARELGIPGCAIDAGCFAAGTFLVYAVLAVTLGSARWTAGPWSARTGISTGVSGEPSSRVDEPPRDKRVNGHPYSGRPH
jgi:hypothetical protein